MGVNMLVQGKEYWRNWLDTQVEEAEIDEAQAYDWEEKYDGYEMIWTFSNPGVPVADGHIDAACIMGGNAEGGYVASDYSDGGFCCGIKYSGDFSAQPEIYALWFSKANYDDWTASVGFSSGVDDTENWRTEDTSYTVSWDVARWLPKERRAVNHYENEYRFMKDQIIKAFAYRYTSDALYEKEEELTENFKLAGALELMATTALTVAGAFVMLA